MTRTALLALAGTAARLAIATLVALLLLAAVALTTPHTATAAEPTTHTLELDPEADILAIGPGIGGIAPTFRNPAVGPCNAGYLLHPLVAWWHCGGYFGLNRR